MALDVLGTIEVGTSLALPSEERLESAEHGKLGVTEQTSIARTPKPSSVHWLVALSSEAGIDGVARANPECHTSVFACWEAICQTCGVSERELASLVASRFDLPLADLRRADSRARRLIPRNVAQRFGILPLLEDTNTITIATSDPQDLEMEEAARFSSGREPRFEVATPREVKEAVESSYPSYPAIESAPKALDSAGSAAVRMLDAHGPDIVDGREVRVHGEEGPTVSSARVLVVDDDSLNRIVVRNLLEKNGYRVSEANDGLRALEVIDQECEDGIDLIVCDLQMPRMDGEELLARVKGSAATAHIAIVVLTGSVDDAAAARLIDRGADDYIEKPVVPARFLARVRATLGRSVQ